MKTKITFLILILGISVITAFAQSKVEVTMSQKEMSQGTQTGFIVFIPESEPKMVDNQWRKFINERSFFEFATKGTSQTVEKAFLGISNIFSQNKKSFGKKSLKVEKNGDELVVKNVIHEEVTNNHVDVYARITGTAEGTFLSSFFQYSDSVFINETNVTQDALTSLQNYIREFGVETYRKVVEGQISAEKKVLRQEETELKKLEKQNKNLHKDIARLETDIDEFKKSINMIEYDLKAIEERISYFKDLLHQTAKKSTEYNSVKEILKEKEKEYKKSFKQIKTLKKNIKNNGTKISKTKADILINKKDQELQQKLIKDQELRVEEFETKLSNIS